MKNIFIIIFIFFISSTTVQSQLIINEILVNEPESLTSLEWIELYNKSSESVSLGLYSMTINNSSFIYFPDSIILDSNEYYVICKRLFEVSGTIGFESYWGDSSGIWGDNEYEQSIQQPFEESFSLTNSGGTIFLYENNIEVSFFSWEDPGKDAVSWERKYSDSNYFYQSEDNSGATPGLTNSVTPVQYDLSIDSVQIQTETPNPNYRFYLTNKGLHNKPSGFLYLSEFDSLSAVFPFDSIEIQPLNPNEKLQIDYSVNFSGYYLQLLSYLTHDDRISNDSLFFIGIGMDYPPLIVTELMANPQDGYSSEWVEIKNRSDIPIDISYWQIGDKLSSHIITAEEAVIEPDEYIIIAQSLSDFLYFYPGISNKIFEPSSWSYFNNDGDMLRLIDNLGIEADLFEYSYTFDNNYSWSRSDYFRWGRSFEQFGSPGKINNVLFEATGNEFTLDINPKYISPDDDGIDDMVEIIIHAPQSETFNVKIYDRYGRTVKTFYDNSNFVPEFISLFWDGQSDDGQRLPIGIYIIYVDAGDFGEIKETIVIAR